MMRHIIAMAALAASSVASAAEWSFNYAGKPAGFTLGATKPLGEDAHATRT